MPANEHLTVHLEARDDAPRVFGLRALWTALAFFISAGVLDGKPPIYVRVRLRVGGRIVIEHRWPDMAVAEEDRAYIWRLLSQSTLDEFYRLYGLDSRRG